MTTFQDPQPPSRRAARQSERGDLPAQTSAAYSDPNAPREMWDTNTRRAGQFSPTPGPTAPSAGSPGRRAAQPPTPVGEPLDYVTQQRPGVPTYDGPSFRPRGSTPPPGSAATAAPPTYPGAEQQQFRPRDFSPESRRVAPGTGSWNDSAQQFAPNRQPSDLDYQTESRRQQAPVTEVPRGIVPPPSQPTAPARPPVSAVPESILPEQTMSRREIRAMQQAQAAASVPELLEPLPPAPPGPSAPSAPWSFGESQPQQHHQQPAPQPTVNTGLSNAISEFDWLASRQDTRVPAPDQRVREVPPAAPSYDEATPWTPPPGHWSAQLTVDDETQPYENTINRTVGSGAITTSALVLPSIPAGDIRGPLTGTGEIMLTGSIDLPQSFSATGASARLEHEGIDRLFDSHDAEIVSTDSAPVSAIRAVSTQSGSNLSHAPKPKGTRALTALLVAAAAMGVVVVGLLVVAFMLGGI